MKIDFEVNGSDAQAAAHARTFRPVSVAVQRRISAVRLNATTAYLNICKAKSPRSLDFGAPNRIK